MAIGILVVVVVAAVLIVPAVAEVFEGDAQSSPESLSARFEALWNDLLQSDFDEKAFAEYADGIIDLQPSDMVDDMLAQLGYTREEYADEYGSSAAESFPFSSLPDYVSTTFDVTVGDQLDGDMLESLSEKFASLGYDYVIADGYELTCEMVFTLNEDYDEYSAGDTETMDFGTAYAIEIDGTWYLWDVYLSGLSY